MDEKSPSKHNKSQQGTWRTCKNLFKKCTVKHITMVGAYKMDKKQCTILTFKKDAKHCKGRALGRTRRKRVKTKEL